MIFKWNNFCWISLEICISWIPFDAWAKIWQLVSCLDVEILFVLCNIIIVCAASVLWTTFWIEKVTRHVSMSNLFHNHCEDIGNRTKILFFKYTRVYAKGFLNLHHLGLFRYDSAKLQHFNFCNDHIKCISHFCSL